ncbi:MAG: type II secretion system protein GspJ, partial [Candidatus Omnitrophica bacterium]|nr:type II secretion system protein GspJ [Candidatus Omnitrophota bacterium]
EDNLLFGGHFSFPVLTDIQEGSFSYFDGTEWYQNWDKEKLPVAILLTILINDEEITFPVGISHE